MLDGLFKRSIDRAWIPLGRVLVRLGMRPNQITWTGLVLAAAACAAYAWHRQPALFGVSLAVVFAFDALDGTVARLTGRTTRDGGYLDAVVDRYQETAVYLTLGWVHGFWAAAFLALSGSLLVSYNKARTAVEIPIDNDAWPDLLERLERLVLICVALVLDPVVAVGLPGDNGFLHAMLVLIGVLAHITAVQRFLRARRLIREHERTRER